MPCSPARGGRRRLREIQASEGPAWLAIDCGRNQALGTRRFRGLGVGFGLMGPVRPWQLAPELQISTKTWYQDIPAKRGCKFKSGERATGVRWWRRLNTFSRSTKQQTSTPDKPMTTTRRILLPFPSRRKP
jgi:hypothetical protein